MSFTASDMRALEIHSQVREAQEMQKLMMELTTNCFNGCAKDFLSGKLSEKEVLKVFWPLFGTH